MVWTKEIKTWLSPYSILLCNYMKLPDREDEGWTMPSAICWCSCACACCCCEWVAFFEIPLLAIERHSSEKVPSPSFSSLSLSTPQKGTINGAIDFRFLHSPVSATGEEAQVPGVLGAIYRERERAWRKRTKGCLLPCCGSGSGVAVSYSASSLPEKDRLCWRGGGGRERERSW